MNSFRSPELVKRYKYNYYDLQTPLNDNVANNNRQVKDNYLFVVDNTSEANPIDWYNAYFEIGFKMATLADSTAGVAGTGNANQFVTTTNGNTFIREIQVEANGITVYNNVRGNETANLLTHLDYTKTFSDSTGTDQFFYP